MLKNLKPRNNEIYLTDALDQLAESGELLASCFEGKRFDVGDKFGYIKANVEMALISTETKEEIKEYVLELAKRL
jgi:UTP--glucose-1-phosphate uridylyltransferase